MKFNSAEEILDFIQDGNDLWSPSTNIYVFVYSEEGAICTYHISHKEAIELSKKAEHYNEDWSAFLGWGGEIYDPPKNLEFCERLYTIDDWILVNNGGKIYGMVE